MARTPETTMNPIGGIADFALNTNGRLIARAEPTGSTGVYNPHWLHHLPF
jgi:acetyl-CoA acetyltransferase